MKKILSVIVYFILCDSSIVFAQYANLQVKEGYDKGRQWLQENYLNALSAVDVLGNGEPDRLQAYKAIAENIQSQITLYRITRDKAYLIKAINMGLDLVNNRFDYSFDANGHKTWADFNNSDENIGYWYDGFMAAALAELAYVMIQHPDYFPELINQPLPAQLIINHLPAQFPPYVPTPLTTYGAIGSWFRDRVNETMVYYWTNSWADDAGFLYGNKSSQKSNLF